MDSKNPPLCPATKKIRFPRRKAALTAMSQARSKGIPVQRVYKCQFCEDWHMTKQRNKNEEDSGESPADPV